ncbi:leucyl aminopeptidase [Nitrospira defluvii]|nr:leucyl aminopeptidase [Nitrospira defluvii]
MMEIKVKSGPVTTKKADILLLGYFEDEDPGGIFATIDRAMKGNIRKIIAVEGFKGNFLQTIMVRLEGRMGIERLLLIGLGKRKELTEDRVRQAMGRGSAAAQKIGLRRLLVYSDPKVLKKTTPRRLAQTVVEGLMLALYTFDRFKTEKPKMPMIEECVLLVPERTQIISAEKGALRGKIIAEGVHYVRDLCTLPSNIVTPSYLAKEAKAIADAGEMEIEVLERADIETLGMGSFQAVAQGTVEPPKFIVMVYRGTGGRKQRPVALIGKSVTFDTGGISLKPSADMGLMKYDMTGGATVLGVMKVLGQLRLPIDVVAILPATDNMPSGSAVHPGDVVTSLSGKTIEIDNTDAEGRLCLADALTYALRYKPTVMIDLATLTGACVVALGQHAIGLMGNNDQLISQIQSTGEETGERLWPLPLWEDYFNQIEGSIADLKNVGGRGAGTITAGLFLKQFVGDVPWVHLDIAGTSWYSDGRHPYIPKGATGVGLRLLTEYLTKLSKRKKR